MAVTDLKISLRKKNTNFAGDGYRLLPITRTEYVDGLLGADGKIDPSLIPAWLYTNRTQAGVIDLLDASQGGADIDVIFYNSGAFGVTVGSEPLPNSQMQGAYVEVTAPGQLVNESARAAEYEIVGAGNAGNRNFPMLLETGDYIVLVKVNESSPKYSFAIVDNTYGDASTTAKGIVKLYNGVNSASTVLAATAGSVKSAYDLAAGKEDAIGTKGTAFNKSFLSGANDGVATTPARSDYRHATFGFTSSGLGANVIDAITITDGIVTALTTQSLTTLAGASGLALATDLDSYATNTALADAISYVDNADTVITTLAKKGLEYYTTVANADDGGHASGDIVAVLEA